MEERKYDLEERTEKFAIDVRIYCKKLKVTLINIADIKQVLRSSGSIGANYIEANEHLSGKDFVIRIKICRKESKETAFWFRVMQVAQGDLSEERNRLHQEATELMRIFAAILRKSNIKKD